MENKEFIDSLTDALKAAGYASIQKRTSSRSLTLSAHKDQRTAVFHIADPEPAPGPRFAVNPDVPDPSEIHTRAHAPSVARVSGSGGGAPPAQARKSSVK